MTRVSRRGFVTAAATVPLLGACGLDRPSAARIALYDPGLAAGRLFAQRARALGLPAIALDQDRVRLLQRVLAERPASLWGLSRHADQLLAADILREHGYRAELAVQHRADRSVVQPRHQPMRSAGALARIAGDQWPLVFAEIAAGLGPAYRPGRSATATGPIMSWAFVRG
ncbi:hypothetical protein [Sphingobium lignivorans]|uniref:Uncharacterized protein n=1 Tax=Sphingobium lignivorans TaxID=2735886 RepID=A0ABR6NHR7_9SPHN|nr:hypothetical protein [Sphingobium lignivorans]MBB5986823.1 hypothetical protein [Sphingobium lignivorans]